jgi:flagellin-like protein
MLPRGVSGIVTGLLLIAIVLISLPVVYKVYSNYIKKHQLSSDVISFDFVAKKKDTGWGMYVVDGYLYVYCAGQACESKQLTQITFVGYDRSSGQSYTLYNYPSTVKLANGVKKIPVVGYYPNSMNIDEVVVKANLCDPTGCTVIYKSFSINR